MRLIPLTHEQSATVDDCDFAWLNQSKWYAIKSDTTYYAQRHTYEPGGGQKTILMHVAVWERHNGPIPSGYTVDHKDHDGVNNQRDNMRLATPSEQMLNRRKRRDNKSGYIGVRWAKHANKWESYFMREGKKYHVGLFNDPIEAAVARDEFIYRNFPSPFNVYFLL